MYGIGEVARQSGLSVSALRFYDGVDVIVPAYVNPRSGYRRYTAEQLDAARIVARLRRVGMPLIEIRQLIEQRHDRAAVDALLDRHLARLAGGLADARRELSTVRSQLDRTETLMTNTTPSSASTATVDGDRLADALRGVRHAVGSDSELPMLCGVLFDLAGDELTVVATDRYRLAVAGIRAERVDGFATQAITPVTFIDELVTELLEQPGSVDLSLSRRAISVRGPGGLDRRGDGVDLEFPDYRRLLHPKTSRSVIIDAAQTRAAVATAPSRLHRHDQTDSTVVALLLDDAGALSFGPVEHSDGGVLVNREFLLQALDGAGPGQLALELDGPIAPLAIRPLQRDRDVALVMPTRLS